MKPTIWLDFDGVIHSYTSGWKDIGVIPDPPLVDRNGVSTIEYLYALIEHFHVCIHSTRNSTPEGIQAMREWLAKWEQVYWDEHPAKVRPRTALTLCIDFPRDKPPALVGIDDRVIAFDGTFPSVQAIKAFKPWSSEP